MLSALISATGSTAQGNARWKLSPNGNNGPAAGRELEMADLLSFIKHEHVDNIVWLTATCITAAAHYYDPAKAHIPKDFTPFWEFVCWAAKCRFFWSQHH